MAVLKPCPFCGSPADEPWFNDEEGNERGGVYCTKCTCSVTSEYVGWLSTEKDREVAINEAVTRWNARFDASTDGV